MGRTLCSQMAHESWSWGQGVDIVQVPGSDSLCPQSHWVSPSVQRMRPTSASLSWTWFTLSSLGGQSPVLFFIHLQLRLLYRSTLFDKFFHNPPSCSLSNICQAHVSHGSQSCIAIHHSPILPSWLWMGTPCVQPFQYFPHTVHTCDTGLIGEKRRQPAEKLALTEQERWHIADIS